MYPAPFYRPPQDFPTEAYDRWKTTDPRDTEPTLPREEQDGYDPDAEAERERDRRELDR